MTSRPGFKDSVLHGYSTPAIEILLVKPVQSWLVQAWLPSLRSLLPASSLQSQISDSLSTSEFHLEFLEPSRTRAFWASWRSVTEQLGTNLGKSKFVLPVKGASWNVILGTVGVFRFGRHSSRKAGRVRHCLQVCEGQAQNCHNVDD